MTNVEKKSIMKKWFDKNLFSFLSSFEPFFRERKDPEMGKEDEFCSSCPLVCGNRTPFGTRLCKKRVADERCKPPKLMLIRLGVVPGLDRVRALLTPKRKRHI